MIVIRMNKYYIYALVLQINERVAIDELSEWIRVFI